MFLRFFVIYAPALRIYSDELIYLCAQLSDDTVQTVCTPGG